MTVVCHEPRCEMLVVLNENVFICPFVLFFIWSCENTIGNCVHSNASRPIYREVQAGVDVAIATKILTLAIEGQLDRVVLLAGDGDFVVLFCWIYWLFVCFMIFNFVFFKCCFFCCVVFSRPKKIFLFRFFSLHIVEISILGCCALCERKST